MMKAFGVGAGKMANLLALGRVLGFAVSIATVLCPVPKAFAWGAEGHAIVALIAFDELTPTAKARVTDLLGTGAPRDFASAAGWADAIKRRRPNTAPWHYVDIELTSQRYDSARDCPNDDCIVERVKQQIRILKDRSADESNRIEALMFVMHLIGDLHQPLHCSDNHDRGGNQVLIEGGVRHANLHEIWDREVVKELGRNEMTVAQGLKLKITSKQIEDWHRGSIEAWATETFRVGRDEVYEPLLPNTGVVDLPDGYLFAESQIAAVQMEKAGVRLAHVLNQALSTAN